MDKLEKELKNNHSKWSNFIWYDDPGDKENWTIYYTSSRDSDILTLANEKTIDDIFSEFFENDSENIRKESHNHWAVGYVNGYAIRIRDSENKYTPEFIALVTILDDLDIYPILDEDLYSEMITECQIENIEDCLKSIHSGYTENELDQVITYLFDYDDIETEDYYPDDKMILAALEYNDIKFEYDYGLYCYDCKKQYQVREYTELKNLRIHLCHECYDDRKSFAKLTNEIIPEWNDLTIPMEFENS